MKEETIIDDERELDRLLRQAAKTRDLPPALAERLADVERPPAADPTLSDLMRDALTTSSKTITVTSKEQ